MATTWMVRRTIASHGLAAVGMSLAWPLLLLSVWEEAGDGWVLGLAGAARMLPYVALSWAAGRLADRFARDRIVRCTLAARAALLVVVAVAMTAGLAWPALAAATCVIAVATPSYPALAAGMPCLAGRGTQRATSLLVTVEVASFVVGPALGGLLLVAPARPLVPWVAVVCTVLAWVLFEGIRLPAPARVQVRDGRSGVLAELRGSATLRGAVCAVAVVNAVVAVAGLALLPLAETWGEAWGSGGSGFGVATAALGFGALGGPALARLGDRWHFRCGVWLGTLAGSVAAVAVAPALTAAVPMLALAGAAAVQVETMATATVQRAAPDRLRATVLGVTDAVMVAAALVGALVAPTMADALGARVTVLLAAGSCVTALVLVRRVPAVGETAVVGEAVGVGSGSS
jgi:MFS family permease